MSRKVPIDRFRPGKQKDSGDRQRGAEIAESAHGRELLQYQISQEPWTPDEFRKRAQRLLDDDKIIPALRRWVEEFPRATGGDVVRKIIDLTTRIAEGETLTIADAQLYEDAPGKLDSVANRMTPRVQNAAGGYVDCSVANCPLRDAADRMRELVRGESRGR